MADITINDGLPVADLNDPTQPALTLFASQTVLNDYAQSNLGRGSQTLCQKIYVDGVVDIAEVVLTLGAHTSGPRAELEFWTDADRAGVQLGDNSDWVLINVTGTTSTTEFTFAFNPPVKLDADCFLHLMNPHVVYPVYWRTSTDENDYIDSNYLAYKDGVAISGNEVFAFKLNRVSGLDDNGEWNIDL